MGSRHAWIAAAVGLMVSGACGQSVSPFWNGSTPLPARQLDAVPPAVAEATRTLWTYYAAGAELNEAIVLRQKEFEASPEYAAALDELDDAHRSYRRAVAVALEPLETDTQREASSHLAHRLREMIVDEAMSDQPDAARIEAMASMRLTQLASLRDDERAMLDSDADVLAARDRFRNAYAELRGLRAAFELSARRDAELAELRRQKRQARTDYVTAAAQRGATIRVAEIALDYSREALRLESRRSPHVVGSWGFTPGYPINWD